MKRLLFKLFIIIIFFLTIFNLYNIYKNIEIKNYNKSQVESTLLSTTNTENVDNLFKESISIEDILEKTNKSVVGISKLNSVGGSIFNNISSDELGLGTGIIVSENGYIISNSHVTGEKFSQCYITVNENVYTGTVMWSEPELDLSITKIDASKLDYIKLGDSKKIRVGQNVFAIGNPIGYEFRKTVTKGIISAQNRNVKIEEENSASIISDLIQTDASINPGNSGGPLINENGEVIGINTVKITSAESIGFAIPINVIKPVIESFIQKNEFNEAYMGINVYDRDVAEYLKLKNKIDSGIYVSKVIINGPAYNSGIKEGDLITSIDEKIINTINDLREYIYTKKSGDTVILKIIRNKKNEEIQIKLDSKK